MFQQLDETIKGLLDDGSIDSEFLTPEKTNLPPASPHEKAVNLFLYEVKENRSLRDPIPFVTQGSNEYTRRMPPLRVDCSYLVTAWSSKQGEGKVKEEHELLALALARLSSFPTIPEIYLEPELTGGLSSNGQIYAPPTMVAQLDGARSMGEFWSALGIPPRPYFNLVVTITMDLDQQIEDSIVTTISSNYIADQPGSGDAHVIIGGTVRDLGGNPVPNTWVWLEELNLIQVTDASGRFVFEKVMARGGLTLHGRASGFVEVERSIEIPSVTGEYDLKFVSRL